jgi:hypothetical protein
LKANDCEKKEEAVECDVDEPVTLSFAVRYYIFLILDILIYLIKHQLYQLKLFCQCLKINH